MSSDAINKCQSCFVWTIAQLCWFRIICIISWHLLYWFLLKNFQGLVPLNSSDWFSFSSQDFLYVSLPLQVREPLQIISDHVVVFTSGTSHNDNTLVIGYLGYFLHRASGAHFAGVNQVIVCWLQLSNGFSPAYRSCEAPAETQSASAVWHRSPQERMRDA